MAISQKYGRTYHYPFSPGTTSDDRINYDYWNCLLGIKELVHTEKLDGENNCLSKYGVFARSHAAPTTSPWTEGLRRFWQLIKKDLGDLEIFLENLYAIHSIEYRKLSHHYHVFAIRENGYWLSWEETKFYAAMLDLPTVPQIEVGPGTAAGTIGKATFEAAIKSVAAERGQFDPYDAFTGKPASREGVVTRNAAGFQVGDFPANVFKYVRKDHVKTDAHWTKNWKPAQLFNEGGNYVVYY
jgi:hypothetical protein